MAKRKRSLVALVPLIVVIFAVLFVVLRDDGDPPKENGDPKTPVVSPGPETPTPPKPENPSGAQPTPKPAATAKLRLRLEHGGKAAGSLTATIGLESGETDESRTLTSDASGTLLIDELVPSHYGVTVDAAGFLPFQAALKIADTTELKVVLETSLGLFGRVVDSSNQPISRATLIAALTDGSHRARAVSGADGGFRFEDLRAGSWKLVASKQGLRRHRIDELSLPHAEELSITLQKDEALVVRVESVDGSPLSGAKVYVRSMGAPIGSPRLRATKTDADGASSISGLPEDESSEIFIRATHGSAPAASRSTTLAELRQNPVLKIPPSYTLSGIVRSKDGQPLASARVQLAGLKEKIRRTTSAGEFSFPGLAAGTYGLCANHRDAGASKSIDIELSANRTDVVLEVAGGTEFVSGQMLSNDGLPLSHVTLRLLRDDANPTESLTDENGRFQFKGLDAGEYRLVANHREEGRREWILSSGKDHKLTFRLRGQLRGRVNFGGLVKPYQLYLEPVDDSGGSYMSLTFSAQRSVFRVERVPAGRYRARAVAKTAPKDLSPDAGWSEAFEVRGEEETSGVLLELVGR
ncbi:MAG: carboxypeptidase regulatory-like domain-containing protein [Planctomycetota bacterium]